MRITVRNMLVLLVCVLLAQSAGASVTHTVGIARDAKSGDVRYIEHHQYLQDGTHLIRYFDTDDRVLLEKEMAYPALPQHPTITQRDYQTDTRISVELENDQAVMTKKAGDERDTFTFSLTPDTVIDAGFDAFIRSNWKNFSGQKRQDVRFAIAGQSRLLDMRIIRTGVDDDGTTRFRVEPASWLVRLLLPAIDLGYNEQRRLVSYKGFSNLKPGQDASREVIIQFEHFDRENPLQAPLPEWISAVSAR